MEPVTLSGMNTISRPTPTHRCTSSQKRRSLASGVISGMLSKRGLMATLPANANNSQRQGQAGQQPSAGGVVDPPPLEAAKGPTRAMDILKPYLLLACMAFTLGFVGYWALGRTLAPMT